MEKSTSPPVGAIDVVAAASVKRKRSPSLEASSLPTPPPAKTARPNPNQLQINYLARQYPDILPLVTAEDTLPSLLTIINDYEGVLQRHESMAGNLGARPLGPILMQRFERIFDGPPKILRNHGKEGIQIGWLDVVEFARAKPEQFNLEKMRDGQRVCQFYTKQCRVEITEEDYQLIASGMPQRLIPPQPIEDDEEKELGTLEILEKNLGNIVQAADQVSARARQLNHRLKNRRTAIVSRRETEGTTKIEEEARSPPASGDRERPPSLSPTSGFTAVNIRPPLSNGSASGRPDEEGTRTANGISPRSASASTRADLLSKFHTSSEREALALASIESTRTNSSYGGHRSSLSSKARAKAAAADPYEAQSPHSAGHAVAIPNTPSALLPFAKPTAADRFDDSGPYKADMMLRMEQLNRGDRVQPPCDRCRRLHMDCLKNLTACMGCTKKHAKCSWKDVDKQELEDHPFVPRASVDGGTSGGDKSGSDGEEAPRRSKGGKKDWSADGRREVRDEELLGESSDEGEVDMDGDGPDTPPPAMVPDDAIPAVSELIGGATMTTTTVTNGAESESSKATASPVAVPSTGNHLNSSTSIDPPSEAVDPSPRTGDWAASDTHVTDDRDADSLKKARSEVRKSSGGMRWDEESGKMMLDS